MANDSKDMKLDIDTSEWDKLNNKLQAGLSGKAASAVGMIMDTQGKKMATWAKANKIWVDRTSHARQRLVGGMIADDEGISAFVAHGVEYGVHLEYKYQRKYAILEKARNKYKDDTIDMVQDFLRKVK